MHKLIPAKEAYTRQLQPQGRVCKKPYSSPRLIEYGDLVELTLSGGSRSIDGAGTQRRA